MSQYSGLLSREGKICDVPSCKKYFIRHQNVKKSAEITIFDEKRLSSKEETCLAPVSYI